MNSVLQETIKEIEVDRSRFIGIIMHIDDKEEVKTILSSIKKRYPKAKHYCYALVIDNYMKSSDDGEPQGTAGRPMLDLLVKNDLNHVLLIVVRYFGGILLGAARLLRTYVDAANEAIKSAHIYQMCEGYSYEISTQYALYESIVSFIKSEGVILEKTSFDELVKLEVFSLKDFGNDLAKQFYKDTTIEFLGKKIKYIER